MVHCPHEDAGEPSRTGPRAAMTTDLVLLALLMGAVTYPWRAVPLLAPGFDRLPPLVLEYLRLVGPAVLAALAAVAILVVTEASGAHRLQFGIGSSPSSSASPSCAGDGTSSWASWPLSRSSPPYGMRTGG